MGFADIFSPEEKIPVAWSSFYELVRASAERDIMLQAIDRCVSNETLQRVFSKKFDNKKITKSDSSENVKETSQSSDING